jgi:hypothetical protein
MTLASEDARRCRALRFFYAGQARSAGLSRAARTILSELLVAAEDAIATRADDVSAQRDLAHAHALLARPDAQADVHGNADLDAHRETEHAPASR